MKSYFPFTDYDFWAYISCGFVFLFALDHVIETAIFQRSTWTIVEGLIAVAAAYVVGHLLAGLSSSILERRFVNKHIGRPSVILLGEVGRRRWFRHLYPEFYEALPKATIEKITAKGRAEGIIEPGEALFWLAYHNVRKDKVADRRRGTFLNLYGLCRNLSLTALIVSGMLIISAVINKGTADYWWAMASAVLGIGMLFRYLKFYRHYSIEVLTTFAYSKGSKTNSRTA